MATYALLVRLYNRFARRRRPQPTWQLWLFGASAVLDIASFVATAHRDAFRWAQGAVGLLVLLVVAANLVARHRATAPSHPGRGRRADAE